MDQSLLIYCLPLLHVELAPPLAAGEEAVVFSAPDAPCTLFRMWPGLAKKPEAYWSAPNFPFGATSAGHCVQQMEALGEAALSGVPMQTLASMDNAPDVQKKRKELRDIANFAQQGSTDSLAAEADQHKALQAAQKALLWAWLLEEKVLEMRTLMASYSSNSGSIAAALGVEQDDDDTALAGLAALDSSLDASLGILPPWSLVLENAALFLPDHSHILADAGPMADNLRDRLTFTPAIYDGIDEARVPLWKALAKSGPRPEQPWLAKEFCFLIKR